MPPTVVVLPASPFVLDSSDEGFDRMQYETVPPVLCGTLPWRRMFVNVDLPLYHTQSESKALDRQEENGESVGDIPGGGTHQGGNFTRRNDTGCTRHDRTIGTGNNAMNVVEGHFEEPIAIDQISFLAFARLLRLVFDGAIVTNRGCNTGSRVFLVGLVVTSSLESRQVKGTRQRDEDQDEHDQRVHEVHLES